MSLRFRNSTALLALAAALWGCNREERQTRGKPLGETATAAMPDTVYPGTGNAPAPDPRAAQYEGNASAIAQGQMLYNQMNCVGCHFHGGGGMGVALMDGKWRYGGRIDQIVASIDQGRPNGMPAWRHRLTEQQMWQLAAYVRTLSGQERKDAVSARADEVSNTPPQTQTKREPLMPADSDEQ
ncbi:c-type cytochrome [Sphingomonas daechungensis]|uniref:C-type cytochrome n=1 Tax=Sphingomonas daechungensis TaxID=1176646 RepID=A0ABX6T249_9SPHN|nr:c-type cytochrome [Sphingomonas daechungensis]QNP43907.1 c-type cytochrome [Sphingomonas daechungensis]